MHKPESVLGNETLKLLRYEQIKKSQPENQT